MYIPCFIFFLSQPPNHHPNNNHPFYTRPSNLIPKELFPVQRKESTSSSKSMRRQVKLPLRKHHSFHFQPSQTVAGVVKSHKSKSHRGPRGEADDDLRLPAELLGASSTSLSRLSGLKTRLMGGNGGTVLTRGPLIFKPYDENSAFKPIQPINSCSNNSSSIHNKSLPNTLLDSDLSNNVTTASSDAKSTTSSSGSDRNAPNKQPASLSVRRLPSDSKRLVYADLLDTSKSDAIDPARRVNCLPKPSRTQYATIQFPEVNI